MAELDWADIGKTLREREAAGHSQRRFAPLLDVDRSTIGKIEVGKLEPSVELARRIESTLELPYGSVFGLPQCFGRVGCEELNFAPFCQGHGPKHVGPVVTRRDAALDAHSDVSSTTGTGGSSGSAWRRSLHR